MSLLVSQSLARFAAAVALGVLCGSAASACAASATQSAAVDSSVESSVELPGIGASPDQVLDAYLTAFKNNDCETAAKLGSSTFRIGNGELCGDVRVDSIDRTPHPAVSGDDVTYAVTLHLSQGTVDGTVPEGPVTWFYALHRQADGSWKITGGGSGP
ncbi:Cif family virulence factor [Nakamurella lactea]|uniref:hypothetical protein n=1 Tax=Nakamurella lactea TaxID=459515 RepID=UPI0003F97569|nr:hypothetical protein [Nakamurella lactea]